MNANDRSSLHVLVPAARSTGGIAVIRSLGRAGYKVHAVDRDPHALGLRSRYAFARAVHPQSNAPEFVDWLTDYVRTSDIRLIIPGSGIEVQNPNVPPEFAALFPTSTDAAILGRGSSKFGLFKRMSEESPANCPPYLLVEFDNPLPKLSDLARLGSPLFIKLDAHHARAGGDDRVLRFADAPSAMAELERLRHHYKKALVQGFVPGVGVGAFLLRWNGKVIARMMHRRLHEMPHTGGASAYRESWWHSAIMVDAEKKLEAMSWQGVAMVEYRWNPATDEFALMETNLRFWGSLHLALFAGVDFPAILADAFFGKQPASLVEGVQGVRCRNTVPYELGYLVSLLRDKDVSVVRKLKAVAESALITFNPRIKSDLLFPGDRMLMAYRIGDMLRGRI